MNITTATMSTTNNNTGYSTFDPDMLLDLASGNTEFIKEMVSIFVEDVPISCKEMTSALSNSDMKTLGHLAHKVKSSVGMIGATELHELVANIEDEAISGKPSATIESMLEKLNSDVSSCCGDLKSFADSL